MPEPALLTYQTKFCKRCGRLKPHTEFRKQPDCCGGLVPRCKPCEYVLRFERSPHLGKACDLWRRCHVCGAVKFHLDFGTHTGGKYIHTRCHGCRLAKIRAFNAAHPNRPGRNPRDRWRLKARRRRLDPGVRIHKRISEMMRRMLGNKKARSTWLSFVDYTIDELRDHLESRFTDGMGWAAFMRGEIHIDHIVPKSSFKVCSVHDDAFRACWSLNNLQPLWATDNMKKGARLPDAHAA